MSEYHVLRKHVTTESGEPEETETTTTVAPVEVTTYELLPETFSGNVRRQVADKYGVGDYVKVPVRSFDEFPVRTRTVVSFQETMPV